MHALVSLRRLALVVGFLALAAGTAPAQEMPAWAAPQELPERPALPDRPPPSFGPFSCPDANPNCIDVTPAPVDGGLVLLALLGTGYAVRRLRRDSDEESDSDDA